MVLVWHRPEFRTLFYMLFYASLSYAVVFHVDSFSLCISAGEIAAWMCTHCVLPHAFFTFITSFRCVFVCLLVTVCVCIRMFEFYLLFLILFKHIFSVWASSLLWRSKSTLVRVVQFSMQARIPFLNRLSRSVCLQFVVWPVLFFSSLKRVASQQEK